eukprot:358526-Chlamydomonas_euryale.AAC.4
MPTYGLLIPTEIKTILASAAPQKLPEPPASCSDPTHAKRTACTAAVRGAGRASQRCRSRQCRSARRSYVRQLPTPTADEAAPLMAPASDGSTPTSDEAAPHEAAALRPRA